MFSLSRPAHLAAGLGGLAWTVKALVITARDDSFGLLESVLFIAGFALLLAAAVLVARDIVHRSGAAGVLAKAAAAIGLFALTFLCVEQGQVLVRGIASGDNLGLEQEGGILLAGLLWLAIAVAASLPRRSAPRTVAA